VAVLIASLNWVTVSSLATAFGTLVLAIATFSAIRSANRSARTAERALLAGMRPLLIQGRVDHPGEPVMWNDEHWAKVGHGKGVAEIRDEQIYLAMPIRNAGTGLAVLHGWDPSPTWGDPTEMHGDISKFRMLNRDIYVASDDTGFWQGAIRETDDPDRDGLRRAIENRTRIIIDVLYGDSEGGQRTVSRFSLTNAEKDGPTWACAVSRHWNIDRDDPR
jgi:hypothetical protein